jgi:hypothetical protein
MHQGSRIACLAKTPGSFYHIKQLSDEISEGITMDIIKIKAEVYQLERQGDNGRQCGLMEEDAVSGSRPAISGQLAFQVH